MESSESNDAGSKKKRIADKQLRSEEVEGYEDEIQEQDNGEFKRADANILAKRKIVRAKRSGSRGLIPENINQTEEAAPQMPVWPSFTTTSSTNGKAEIPSKEGNGKEEKEKEKQSTPSKTPEEKKETPESKKVFGDFSWISKSASESESKETKSPTPSALFSFSSFSSTPEKTTNFPTFESTKSIFNFNVDAKITTGEFPSFASSPETKREKPTLPPAEPVKTGEEEEQHVYQTRAKLFTMDLTENKWKERGVGNIRVNVSQDGKEARLVMRVDASLRLILNTRVWPNMVVEKAGSKELRFIGTSIDSNEITTYLVRVAKPEMAEELLKAIEDQKKVVNPAKPKEDEE